MADGNGNGGGGTSPGKPPQGGTTITTDSSGGARISLNLSGVIASIWGGVFGISAVAGYIEDVDWYRLMGWSYIIGFILSLMTFAFYWGIIWTLTDPERRPINGPVEITMIPGEDGEKEIKVLYYKELPVEGKEEEDTVPEGGY